MNKKSIKYIAYYNDDKFNQEENRNTFLAIKNKVDYICSALNRNGFEVEIVSPCWSNNEKGFYKGTTTRISDGVILRNFFTFGTKGRIGKNIKQILSAVSLLKFMLFNVKKNDKVIVYHSVSLIWPIIIAKYIKNIDVILEVEEIYSDVWKGTTNYKKEIKYIKQFKKYIFASDKLKELFSGKPNIVIYGAYKVISKNKKISNNCEEINLVYAGSIDKVKGGAFNAIKSMKYLPNNYKLNILGFGEERYIIELIKEIKKINKSNDSKRCLYHGILVNNEYSKFLLKCDIGLNPQIQGEYMNSAFPSKILSYLSHHLKVVSTEIESIKISQISNQINFTIDDSPKSIAKEIMKVKFNSQDNNKSVIEMLDKKFVKDVNILIQNSNNLE